MQPVQLTRPLINLDRRRTALNEPIIDTFRLTSDFASGSVPPIPGMPESAASVMRGCPAAGAALRLRDKGLPLPRAVLLVYPLLHAELAPMPAELAAKAAMLPHPDLVGAEAIRRMNLNYVRDPAVLDEHYAFPGGHDLSGLPPTFILNSDLDPLRASGQKYGAELAAAGVDVVMIREDGVHHGHLNEPDNPGALLSITRMADWLRSPTLLDAAHEREAVAAPKTGATCRTGATSG